MNKKELSKKVELLKEEIWDMQKPNRHTEKGRRGEIGYLNLNCQNVINKIDEIFKE